MCVQHLANPMQKRLHHECLLRLRFCGRGKPQTQEPVHGSLLRLAAALDLQINQSGYVVVEGESGSHIMMLT